ncbi:MAG: hypothetical protein ACXWT4_10805, partial [Methylobacter sp.]
RNDSTRCRKACIFTTQKALRENTCTIASGDYSTPVSQRSIPVLPKKSAATSNPAAFLGSSKHKPRLLNTPYPAINIDC